LRAVEVEETTIQVLELEQAVLEVGQERPALIHRLDPDRRILAVAVVVLEERTRLIARMVATGDLVL
jgi:hypothetical protein